MPCLRSRRPSPNHPTLHLTCTSTLALVGLWYMPWAWISQTAHSPYPSSHPGVLSFVCPSHLQNYGHQGSERCWVGSDVHRWKGWGEEKESFSNSDTYATSCQ